MPEFTVDMWKWKLGGPFGALGNQFAVDLEGRLLQAQCRASTT